jgi:hypothetical protein
MQPHRFTTGKHRHGIPINCLVEVGLALSNAALNERPNCSQMTIDSTLQAVIDCGVLKDRLDTGLLSPHEGWQATVNHPCAHRSRPNEPHSEAAALRRQIREQNDKDSA